MDNAVDCAQRAMEHVKYLAVNIGARGSCTSGERQGAEYAAGQMKALGLQAVQIEPFRGVPSTYRPYALAFVTALLGAALSWLPGGAWPLALAALLNLLGAWAMLAETDLAYSWSRRLLPSGTGHNAVGIVPPRGPVRQRVVLCAHLDTHRTPIFYSSLGWLRLFSTLVGLALVSMFAGALLYTLGALAAGSWPWVRWAGLLTAAMPLFALVLCIHADRTPFTPGANDNASGVATSLALAERLCAEPLAGTEVCLAFTGNEETGASGMAAFLDRHSAPLGSETMYVALDQVGVGCIVVLTADGLVLKRKTHPRALALARQAHACLPDLALQERVGIAYTDGLVATRRGLAALTVASLPERSDAGAHWHQMSDRVEHVEPRALADACAFTWQLLRTLDAGE